MHTKTYGFLKRSFDLAASLGGLLILSPIMFAITLLIINEDGGEDGGPVFYRGVRVGRYGAPFRIFKFRTMVKDAEKIGPSSTGDDDPRITKIGKYLRRYKLDELPQLINVLKGDMSMVGPRPQVPWAVELFNSDEKILLQVRPGITDYASIKFHNEGEILAGYDDADKAYMEIIHPEKMRLAVEYVKEMSVVTDTKIIFTTLLKLVK